MITLNYKSEFSTVEGHDTTVENISQSFGEFFQLERIEQQELLADLYRDDSTSDAGYVLLDSLVEFAKKLTAEDPVIQLDVLYVIVSIQIEYSLNVKSDFRELVQLSCSNNSLLKIREMLKSINSEIFEANDIDDLESLITKLDQIIA